MHAIASPTPTVPRIALGTANRSMLSHQEVLRLVDGVCGLTQTLALFRDDGQDNLMMDCRPLLCRRGRELELHGNSVVEHCRQYLRPSNLVIVSRPDKGFQSRIFYVNRQTGAVLDPTTYLKLSMDSPRDISIPVLALSTLQAMVASQVAQDLPLLELDFVKMVRDHKDYSRTLQYALRHRLRRFILAGAKTKT